MTHVDFGGQSADLTDFGICSDGVDEGFPAAADNGRSGKEEVGDFAQRLPPFDERPRKAVKGDRLSRDHRIVNEKLVGFHEAGIGADHFALRDDEKIPDCQFEGRDRFFFS